MTLVDVRPAAPAAAPLWPHQAEAVDRALQHDGFLLAIGMGGGKSRCAIEVAERTAATRVLIVCPKSVIGVWPSQLAEHAARRWDVWAGKVNGSRGELRNPSVARRAEALIEANKLAIAKHRPFAAVVNFEASHLGQMGELLRGTPWDLVIIDESHRIKAPGGKASKHIARVCHQVRARGGRILALTGTPMPHSPLDIWGQLRALDGGDRLGTSYHRFCMAFGAGEVIRVAGGIERTIYKDVRADRLADFTGRIAPVMFQKEQAELDAELGLPETVDVQRSIDLDPKTRAVYQRLERDLIADVEDDVVVAANAMVLTTRLGQLSGGFSKNPDGELVHVADPPEKARLLADVLEDLDEHEPVVVFCRFHADLDAVRGVAERLGRTYGELSGRRRDGLTADSKMAPHVTVLGCQLQSGGVGIDLTRARYAIYYSLDFRLSDYDQSRKRVHRPGQTRRTTYVHLLANDTIDWAVFGALRKRRDVVNAVLERLQKS